MKRQTVVLSACAAVVWIAGCTPPGEPRLPEVVVYKNANCGCCKLWAQRLQEAGFGVTQHDSHNLNAVKQRMGVPARMGSCHTAQVGGYFVEGHVPVEDIKRLLSERPEAAGLAVPGMPIGSPGMEQGDRRDPYEVLLVQADGSTSVFSKHGP